MAEEWPYQINFQSSQAGVDRYYLATFVRLDYLRNALFEATVSLFAALSDFLPFAHGPSFLSRYKRSDDHPILYL